MVGEEVRNAQNLVVNFNILTTRNAYKRDYRVVIVFVETWFAVGGGRHLRAI